MTIKVQYAVKYDTIEVTVAEFDLIHALYNRSAPQRADVVTAIKFIRLQHNLSLRQAKDICDSIGATPALS